MSYLKERLETNDRNAIIADTVRLIDAEVQRKSGLTGMALKGGYKAVKKMRSGTMISKAVDFLLDDFTEALAPMHDSFRAQDTHTTFDRYLVSQGTNASDALLTITDRKAANSENRVVKATYNKLRGQAQKHVLEALPGVGRLIDTYVPREEA